MKHTMITLFLLAALMLLVGYTVRQHMKYRSEVAYWRLTALKCNRVANKQCGTVSELLDTINKEFLR